MVTQIIKEQVENRYQYLWDMLETLIANGEAPAKEHIPEEWKKANGK